MNTILIDKTRDGYAMSYLVGKPSLAFGSGALRGFDSASALRASLAEEGVPAEKISDAIDAVNQHGTTTLSFLPELTGENR